MTNHKLNGRSEGSYSLRLIRKVGGALSGFSSRGLLERSLREAGVQDAAEVFSYTKPGELEALYQLARNCPPSGRILEIGSHLGASTCYLGAGAREINATLYCVDTWKNDTMPEGQQDTYPQFKKNTGGLGETVVAIRKSSTSLSANDLRTPLNLVFIDADHSYEGVKLDFEIIRPWLAPTAVVAFHDTVAAEGVGRLLGEVLASGAFRITGHVQNLSWVTKV